MRAGRWAKNLWRAAAFRLAIVFASIFGMGAALMLVLLDLGVAEVAEGELRDALRHQMAIMRADAQLEGGEALARILAEHVRTDRVSRYRYLVVPSSGTGFNSGIPEAGLDFDGFGSVDAPVSDVSSIGKSARVEMLVLTRHMPDGTFLAVGRENYPLEELRKGLNRVAVWGSVLLAALAVGAGLVAGFLFLRRLELVNETTGRIIDGNISERLPSIGFGQEFHDLTRNLNIMLDRLEAAITAMRQISTDVAHDLRMPLTRLRSRLEALDVTSAGQAAQIDEAIGEVDELLALFNAILRLARLEAGSVRYEMVAIDLSRLAEQAIEAYRPAAEEGGRQLVGRLEGERWVIGDAGLLSQLLANLIDNALYHTPQGTRVEVEVRSEGDGVLLAVRDDGTGVPESELPNLTKRFYRADHSRSRPGTGLGLTLAAAIVELHRAGMTLVNRSPGLCVEVRFARADTAA